MVPLALLPAALITLLLASPVFSAPTSTNDLFRAIASTVLKQPEPPICCLIPLEPLEPVDDEVFLSFEDWKAKQSATQAQTKAKEREREKGSGNHSTSGHPGTAGTGNGSDTSLPPADVVDAPSTADVAEPEPTEPLSPHFRVPLTDRFNYASLDCSARVHTAHRAAKSPASILSSKRDRYMLSPCAAGPEGMFVVVELCDDICIDTVQLANFEFFSGVFRDFTVRVAKTYDADAWTLAGTYRAKNVRGVQSFHPPTSLRDFYRYIRIDFHSHYGNEYYCPVSLLRVYGLTHLEQWKWEVWEDESRKKRIGLEAAEPPPAPIGEPPQPAQAVIETGGSPDVSSLSTAETKATVSPKTTASNVHPVQPPSTPEAELNPIVESTTNRESSTPNETHDSQELTLDITTETTSTPLTSHRTSSSITSETSSASLSSSWKLPPPESISVGTINSSARILSSPPPLTPLPTVTPAVPTHSLSSAVASTGGESIYRIIMNRLTALETNHTLYARYLEDQTTSVREMIRRLSEDVGRLEGIGKAQAQMYQRTVQDLEEERRRLHSDYSAMISRVNYLSDQIVLEKRIGIAQLCFLSAVLLLLGLTRGSRGESLDHAPARLNKSMREWGRRHLSFSGDWTSPFRGSSRSPQPKSKPKSPAPENERANAAAPIPFPTWGEPLRRDKATSPAPVPALPARKTSRSRTPSSLRTPVGAARHFALARPASPTAQARAAGMLRAASQGSAGWALGAVPRSARRWARSAHLHEVRARARGLDGENVDVFSSGGKGKAREGALPLFSGGRGPLSAKMEEGEGDAWVDTDASVDSAELDGEGEAAAVQSYAQS